MEVASLKRLVDGKMLAKALGVKPGKWMARALDVCLEWQLRHPHETEPLAAVEEVWQRRAELDIPSE
jgi:tRNA nucleotidyltransferase (CCA-adding enzyme)